MQLIEEYLSKFPNGKYREQLLYQRFDIETTVYEFEGHASVALSVIKQCEDFLKKNPKTSYRNDLLFFMNYLYRVAIECVNFAPGENALEGNGKNKAAEFKSMAVSLCSQLMASPDLLTRENARVALFNTIQNRRVYQDPNEW
jgi:hypothetical protein